MNSSNGKTLAIFVALTVLGLAGNYLRFPVFFSIEFLFGSIFSMLALQVLGARLGVLSAVLVSSSTYLLWNHPYAIVIFTAEALVVAWLTTRKRVNLVNADVIYWCAIGMPLVFLFYYYAMELPLTNATVTMLKQAVNGIANALMARFLFFGISWRMRQAEFAMRELIFNFLFLFVLLPSLLFIAMESRHERDELDQRIRQTLAVTGKRASANLEDWLQSHVKRIAYLAELAARNPVPEMQRAVVQLGKEDDEFLRVGLMDRNATAVAYSELIDELGHPNIGKSFADRPFIPTLKQTLRPMLSEVVMGKVGKPQPIVIVLAPVVASEGYAGYVTGILSLASIEKILALNTQSGLSQEMKYALLDRNGNVIVTNNPTMAALQPFKRLNGEMLPLAEGLKEWLPEAKRHVSFSERWKNAVYVYESKIGAASEWTLIFDMPVQPFQLTMYEDYTWTLLRLVIVLLVGLLLAGMLSKAIVTSLEELKLVTADLPNRLSVPQEIDWGRSIVREIQSLIDNFRNMAQVLTQKFSEIQQFNAALEQQVAIRTEELNNQSLRLGTLLETASDGIHVLDEDGNLLQYSQSFLTMLGYSRQEAATLNVKDWEAKIAPDQLSATISALIRNGDTFQTLHRRKDGAIREVEVNAKGIELDGKPCLYASARDITERRQAELLIRESESRFRTMADTAPVLIWIAGTDKLCNWFNKVWLNFTGRTMQQEFGNGWTEGVHPEDLAGCMNTYANAFDARKAFVMEYRLRRFDGEYRWLVDNGVPRHDDTGTFCGYIGSCLDITDRKAAHSELEQHRHHLEAMVEERTAALSIAKEAAEAASRAKSTFLATMSHELRTPLNAIMGMTELAQRRVTDPRQGEQLGKVSRASQHLLAIIKDVLDISRVEAEKLKLERIDFNLDRIIENVGDLMRGPLNDKSLELLIDFAPEVAALELQGDPQRLAQILLNLTSNAVKFTVAGSVTLSARLVEETPTDVLLRFEVRDTGIGIAAEDQGRLFAAFEQVDGSYTRKYGGTGLGLAISKRLAEMMGGEIGLNSQVGLGSTFWFTARLGKAGHVAGPAQNPAADPARGQLQARHAGAYILVAEDEPLNREIAQGLLEEAGLVVHVADDGARAVEMARRINYDLILMDIQMPSMDGFEATRRIRQSSSNAPRVPIVAFTANVFPEDEARCREAGMDDFIGRPVESAALYATVLKWLDRLTD